MLFGEMPSLAPPTHLPTKHHSIPGPAHSLSPIVFVLPGQSSPLLLESSIGYRYKSFSRRRRRAWLKEFTRNLHQILRGVRARVLTWPYPDVCCMEVHLLTGTAGKYTLVSYVNVNIRVV
jgi:hypothetical protein